MKLIRTFDAEEWQPLVDALRDELQEYGELAQLLEEQQQLIFRREAEALLRVNREIDQQLATTSRLRQSRENEIRLLARIVGLDEGISLRGLLPAFPEMAQPLFQALTQEIQAMIERTRKRARQNQMLLSRACDVMEQLLRNLRPASFTKTYTRQGQVALRTEAAGTTISALG